MGALKDGVVTFVCRLLRLFFPRSSSSDSLPQSPSVLILKPCCIGDVLMSTAAVAALRYRFPQARIVYGTGSWSRPVLANNPHLDELWDIGSVGSGARTRPRDYLSLVRRIRREGFSACLVLDRSPLLTLIPFLAGVPVRAGLDSQYRGFSLTHRVPCRHGRHEAELYLDVARALGARLEDPRLEFFPSEADEKWAEERLLGLGRPRLAIHPGGGVNPGMTLALKRWPASRFAAVARCALEASAGVVLAGSASDREAVGEVLASLNHPGLPHAGLLDLSEGLTLDQLGAVLQRCDVFVGNDSGPLHLAVAVGTVAVGIFGPSSPDSYWPFDPDGVAVYKGVACSPCFVQGRASISTCDHRCMAEIGVADVWQVVEPLLRRAAGTTSDQQQTKPIEGAAQP